MINDWLETKTETSQYILIYKDYLSLEVSSSFPIRLYAYRAVFLQPTKAAARYTHLI